jgi:hypothetical protein
VDPRPEGERLGRHLGGQGAGGVDPNAAEVGTESVLHAVAELAAERRSTRGAPDAAGQLRTDRATLVTDLRLDAGRRRRSVDPSRAASVEARCRHPGDDLIGDAVGFTFEGVVGSTDGEPRGPPRRSPDVALVRRLGGVRSFAPCVGTLDHAWLPPRSTATVAPGGPSVVWLTTLDVG